MPINTELRRLPRQSRGRRRVEALLNAAAAEISDAGYEAATMCSIATRAGASIGSLYQFFPNKAAIVQALRRHYCDEFELMWAPLASEAKHLSWEELVIRLVDSTVLFVDAASGIPGPAGRAGQHPCACCRAGKIPATGCDHASRPQASHVAGKSAAPCHDDAADDQSDEFSISRLISTRTSSLCSGIQNVAPALSGMPK